MTSSGVCFAQLLGTKREDILHLREEVVVVAAGT